MMMINKKYFCSWLLLFLVSTTHFYSAKAQENTLLLLNGKKLNLFSYRIIGVDGDSVISYTTINGKNGKKYFDRIFSLTNTEGKEKIFYRQNPEIGNELSVHEMKMFVEGCYFGHNLKISPLISIGSFALGLGSAFIPYPYLGIGGTSIPLPINMLVPVANTVAFNNIYTPKKKLSEKVPNLNNANEYYVMGIEESLRKKRVKHSLIGGIIGFVAGTITVAIIANQ